MNRSWFSEFEESNTCEEEYAVAVRQEKIFGDCD